jgi:hypothetical protein
VLIKGRGKPMAGATMELGPVTGGDGNNNKPPLPIDFDDGEYHGPDRRGRSLPDQYMMRYGHAEGAGTSPLDLEKLARRRTDAPIAGSIAIEGVRSIES